MRFFRSPVSIRKIAFAQETICGRDNEGEKIPKKSR